MKKIISAILIVLSLSLVGAKCKKVGGGQAINLDLSGELKNGQGALGLTKNIWGGNNVREDIFAKTASIKIENGKVTGEYNWGIEVDSKNMVGDIMSNSVDEKGTFEAEMIGNEFIGTFSGDRIEVLISQGNMSETTGSQGEIYGIVTDEMVKGYLGVPQTVRNGQTMGMSPGKAENLQKLADDRESLLKKTYLFFEIER